MKFKILSLFVILAVSQFANAYMFQNIDILVDYWAGTGGNETILVIDWNTVNTTGQDQKPYVTESHAFGYRWDGTLNLSSLLLGVAAVGNLNINVTTSGWISQVNYNDGIDSHIQTDDDWIWTGETFDAGVSWASHRYGANDQIVSNGSIQALNILYKDWSDANLNIPTVPEPATIAILGLGALLLRRKKA